MPTGARRPLTVSSGPTVGPRLVPPGGAFAPADEAPLTELRFVATELLQLGDTSVSAGGIAAVVFNVPADRVWMVERVTVFTTSTQPTTAVIYVGTVDRSNIADLTPDGNGDVADEINPIVVPAGSSLRVRWTGANDGAACVARIQGWAGSLAALRL